NESRDANKKIEKGRREKEAAGGKRKERLRDLIETDRHAAGSKAEPAFHEAREQISSAGAAGNQGSNLPLKAHQQGGKRRRHERRNDTSDRLGRPEQGPAVGQDRAAVERLSKLIAESFLDEHRCSVGHDEKDQELKD